jgi:hypothetical protein
MATGMAPEQRSKFMKAIINECSACSRQGYPDGRPQGRFGGTICRAGVEKLCCAKGLPRCPVANYFDDVRAGRRDDVLGPDELRAINTFFSAAPVVMPVSGYTKVVLGPKDDGYEKSVPAAPLAPSELKVASKAVIAETAETGHEPETLRIEVPNGEADKGPAG